MYVGQSYTYYSGSEQRASRGDFLMIATFDTDVDYQEICEECGEHHKVLFACVRKVAMGQFGHFMMGTARVGGQSLTVSGPIGHDGLPMAPWNTRNLSDDMIARYFVKVPVNVAHAYWTAHGWNDCGEATPVLRSYGRQLAREKHS